MSQLRTYLENYLQTLQTLQTQHSNNQELLDAAERQWGQDDPRYEVLLERTAGLAGRFNEPSTEPPPESDNPENEPNELIDWLPSYVQMLQDVLAQSTNDEAILKQAENKWKSRSYGYLLFKK